MRGVATNKRELPPELRDLVSSPGLEGDLRKLLGRMTPGQRRALWLGAFIAIGHTSIADGLRAWIRANQLAPLDEAAEAAGAPSRPPAPVVPIRPRPQVPVMDAQSRADRDAHIVELVTNGYPQTDVAEAFGVSSQRVSQIVRKHRRGMATA